MISLRSNAVFYELLIVYCLEMDEDSTSAESSTSERDTEPDKVSELYEASDDQHYGAGEKRRRKQGCKKF